MPDTPLLPVRPRLFTDEQLWQIYAAAVQILTANSLKVDHDRALIEIARAGYRVAGKQVFFRQQDVEEFISQEMACGKTSKSEAAQSTLGNTSGLKLNVHQYQASLLDIETDEIRPYTTESLIECTKLVDTMADQGVAGGAPGVPSEIPGDLQQIAKYKIAAEYSQSGRQPVAILSARMRPYIMEMAEVLGCPVQGQHTFVVTPFTLHVEFLDTLLSEDSRLTHVTVSDLASVGGTLPIRITDALALAAAEVIGAAMVLRAITPLRVHWYIRVCPIDLRTLVISHGAPEEILFQLASDEVNAFFHGQSPGPPLCILHSQAKAPDPQAASERMCQLTFGALFGTRDFGGAGTLSLDEVFSPEQLLIDCEMRDHVERLIRGIITECDPAQATAEVTAGLQSSFIGLDTTAALLRQVYWTPHLFERRSLAGWRQAGQPNSQQLAKARVREQLKQYNYELDPDLRREIHSIYERAKQELAG
jgi:trimethylamine:corrinoid methyltransferase-like protein